MKRTGESDLNSEGFNNSVGEAVRILVNEVENKKTTSKIISMADNIINDEERGLI